MISASSSGPRSGEIAQQELPKRLTQPNVGDEIFDSLGMRSRVGQRLDQQLAQIEDLDSPTAERLGEPVVLLLSAVDPGQPIEEQGIVIAWASAASARCQDDAAVPYATGQPRTGPPAQ